MSALAYAEDENQGSDAQKRGMVIVEPVNVIIAEDEKDAYLSPYLERRSSWGTTVSVGYSSYEPLNYEPDFVAAAFEAVYKNPNVPLIDLQFVVKKNMSIGSLGVELAVGHYEVASYDKTFGDSKLTLNPVRVGAVFNLDALAPTPYFVPYVAGGMYTMLFNESLGGASHNGNTQASAYFHGGVAFSLHWIDRHGSIIAYRESGVEATYAYLELQKYMKAGAAADGDFSNEISYSGGVRLEF